MPEQIAWPDWLEGLSSGARISAIISAVARSCPAGSPGRGEDGGQYCSAATAEVLLSWLLEEARAAALPPDPYPLPGSGVKLWHSVSSFEAVQIGTESDLDAIAGWCGGVRATVTFDDQTSAEGVRLLTRHGHVTAVAGNWIAFDGTPPSVWEPSAFPARFEPVVPVTPESAEPPRKMCPETHPAYQTSCTWLEQHGSKHRDASGAEWLAPIGEPEPPPARLANVEVKGFRDLGVVAVSEITLAGVPFLHAESRDGSAADFPASSVHFIAWLPPGSPWPEKPRAIASTRDPWADDDGPDDGAIHDPGCHDPGCNGDCALF